jgi:hypothetical protein
MGVVQLRLADADEADAARLPVLQRVQALDRRTPRPVELPDRDQIDPPMPGVGKEFAPALPSSEVGSPGVVHVLIDDRPSSARRVLPHRHELDFRILILVSGADSRARATRWRRWSITAA